jgi:hypothetical protein
MAVWKSDSNGGFVGSKMRCVKTKKKLIYAKTTQNHARSLCVCVNVPPVAVNDLTLETRGLQREDVVYLG